MNPGAPLKIALKIWVHQLPGGVAVISRAMQILHAFGCGLQWLLADGDQTVASGAQAWSQIPELAREVLVNQQNLHA